MFWQTCFKADQKTYCSYAPLRGMFEALFTRYVLTDMFQSRPKDILLIRAFTRYVWQSCLWIFPSKIICFVYINLNMEEDNFVIPACMLVIAAFWLINMNLSLSDGVKLTSSFLFLCRILNQVAKFCIETETHQWHVIFFICIIYF